MAPTSSLRINLHLLLLLLLLRHANSQSLQGQEQAVLLKFKSYLQSPPFLSHWIPSNSNTSSHCSWPEISCTNNSVTGLYLVNLNITLPVPPFICDLTNLTHVDLNYNRLPGEFPKSLYKCSKLEYLDLSQNYFVGPIPDDIDTLPRLMQLILAANNFSGDIPPAIGRLQELESLQLWMNGFNGSVPPEIGNLSNLKYLNMSFNVELMPWTLPSNFTKLKKLKNLSIRQSNLIGELPETLGEMEALEVIDLAINSLSGRIPNGLFTPKNLSMVYLYNNNLSGEVPQVIGSWNLSILDISENTLTGTIPDQLGRLKLNQFNLSSNHLSGQIPIEFENSAYEGSFLDNQGLCAPSSPAVKLPICNSESRKASKLSSKSLALILSLGILLCLLAFSISVRSYRKSKRNCYSKWKLTSFERLNFTELEIKSGLTESNLIGSGGSGKVYRVPVNRNGDVVAVKKIRKNKNLEEKPEKEFLAEVKILSSIRHANIVKLMCCISSRTSELLVYEYSDNRSLDRWLHRRNRPSNLSRSVQHVALDWPKRLQIAVGAAQGLSYMHHDCVPPVVHRNVKSSNILLDSDFNAKIADFGLAKMLVKQGELATMSSVAGSLGYMAPEYAHTTRVNEKMDVYSFGVILLELTTGREANGGDEHTALAEWAWRHVQEEKAIADALDPDVKEPRYLDEMCSVFKLGLICTERLPASRPSMEVVLEILTTQILLLLLY